MLTIQPGLANSFNQIPAFGRCKTQRYAEDVDCFDYEYNDKMTSSERLKRDNFDIEEEKADAKRELDLWKETQANVNSISKTTDMVPGLKTGTKILGGLTAIAVGWGGLRWGTVGTLEVLSKIGKTKGYKAVKNYAKETGTWISEQFSALQTAVAETQFYKAITGKINKWQDAFENSSTGKTLSRWEEAINKNPFFKKAVTFKDKTVEYFKNLNYKRVVVEGMGIAGGGAAVVNLLSRKPVDGCKENVDVAKDGSKYYVNGREMIFNDEGDVFDAA